MRRRRSLSLRVFLSYLAVVVLVVGVLFGTARLLGPRLFGGEVERIGLRYGWEGDAGPGRGPGGGEGTGEGPGLGEAALETELNSAFSQSLTLALVVAVGVGAAAAIAGAALMSRRVLGPLDRVRGAVRRMASGHYGDSVPEPADAELADLAADVNELGAALAESEQRRVRLVSDVAHELRTPITSLEGYLEGIEDGVFHADPDTLTAMREETRRLQRLAADLSALSRADEGAFDLAEEPDDLSRIAVAAARGLAPAFAAAGVELQVPDPGSLPVVADPDRIGQVVANLLRNALQHTPAGGRVTVTGHASGGQMHLVVTDTGAGIAPEHLPHLFERFYRVEGSARPGGGTGIGLTIARAIARAHGGEVTAASEGPDRGAQFTLTLPGKGQAAGRPA